MALGGFIYGGSLVLGPHENTRTKWEVDWSNILDLFHTLPGWASYTPLTRMVDADPEGSNFAISKYGSVGDNGYLVWVFSMQSTAALIHADNYVLGTTLNGATTLQPTVWLAYVPPGVAPPGVGDSRSAAWLNAGSLRFQKFCPEYAPIYALGQACIHVLAREETVIILGQDNTNTIDNLYMAGPLVAPLAHGLDSNPYLAISNANASRAGLNTSFMLQAFTAAGTRIWSTIGLSLSVAATSPLLTRLVSKVAPWAWSKWLCYITNADLTTYGIIAGNGVKGIVNPEAFRFIQSGVNPKQLLESGNLIHLSNGYVVGWDPSNGAMD